MYKIIIIKTFAYSPKHWQNMVDYLTDHGDTDSEGVTVNCLNQELKQFDARYVEGDSNTYSYIEFENEAGYTFYILKWS